MQTLCRIQERDAQLEDEDDSLGADSLDFAEDGDE
jgi:acyl carrier protein